MAKVTVQEVVAPPPPPEKVTLEMSWAEFVTLHIFLTKSSQADVKKKYVDWLETYTPDEHFDATKVYALYDATVKVYRKRSLR